MADQPSQPQPQKPGPTLSKMEKLVALCRRTGYIWQSSEIYGGINGFWDYGPLGVELKRNLKDAWWRDIVRCPGNGPDGEQIKMVGLDCTIIMNPKVWVASGHVGGFSDPMVDCRACKSRFRADHLETLEAMKLTGKPPQAEKPTPQERLIRSDEYQNWILEPKESRRFTREHLGVNIFGEALPKKIGSIKQYFSVQVDSTRELDKRLIVETKKHDFWGISEIPISGAVPTDCPKCGESNSLTEPRQFNLMFESYAGAVQDESSKVYLRPETAQGIFANFRNVTDTQRVKVPFGIAQIGKAFRNEVTPRNFTFRSREFEQMEIEFFIRPETAHEWYKFWRESRFQWWQSIGLTSQNLQLREHDKDELAHYAKTGAGTSDIEYKFPFTDPGFGELEGVAHRADFDLKAHAEHSGLGDKLKYFDQEKNERYFPHVIEPSAGADRGTLALLCEAYTDDPGRPSGVVMKFHPRMAPIKAAIFPLVDKEGMPEIATKLYHDLRQTWNVQLDIKQNIGKRYARMDEAGTPFCFTVDTQTLADQTVTVRHRDTLQQDRINISQVRAFLQEKIGG